MSKNIARNEVPLRKGFVQTKIIFKTIMVVVALFGLLGSVFPSEGIAPSPIGTLPVEGREILVNDIGDAYWDPFGDTTASTFGNEVGAVVDSTGTAIVNAKGENIVTLRHAIENTNRDCDTYSANGEGQTIRFNWAEMTLDGKPIPAANQALSKEVTEGTKDLAGFYSGAGFKTFRLSLNTFLPDLICGDTVIDAETGNTNAPIGKGQTTGILGDARKIDQIKQPMLELMPKKKGTYVRAVSNANKLNTEDNIPAVPGTPGTPAKPSKYSAVFNCGLYLRADNQVVQGLSIFGFGGGGINDANICVGPYSSQAGAWAPDPAVNNPIFPNATAYFPINNKNGYCWAANKGYPFSSALFNSVETDAADANCGAFITNQPEYSSMYETASVDNNNITYQGSFNGNTAYESAKSPDQNSQNNQIYRNVVGATATLLSPAKASFNWFDGYSSADAAAIANADFHSKGSGIMALASDKGFIHQNIIMYNGGTPRSIAAFGSQAGVLFEIASYSGSPVRNSIEKRDPNASPLADEVLNTEAWVVSKNELAMNIDNNRDFGGHGIFINIAQNGSDLNPDWFHELENNDIYQNGGSGIRTFSPRVNVIGNKVYNNGKDENQTAADSVIETAFTATAPADAVTVTGTAPNTTTTTTTTTGTAPNQTTTVKAVAPTTTTTTVTPYTNPAPKYTAKVKSFKHGIYMECGTGYVLHNEVFGHDGSAVATSGGNMYCANGGEQIEGGVVISENSFYNNKKLGIDLFVEYNINVQDTTVVGPTPDSYKKYINAPSNNSNFEKPIGSENDIDSINQFTGPLLEGTSPSGDRQYVTLNTVESLETIRVEAVKDANVPRAFATAINGQNNVIAGNLSTPFPIFTYVTQDCSTKKIRLHGFVANENVVEVFRPDFDGNVVPDPKVHVEAYQEGKTYLFDFTDNDKYASVEKDLTLTKIHEKYSNKSVIYDEAGVPLSAGKINDLPYLDPATGLLTTYSKAGFTNVDKVVDNELMTDLKAHEFTIETDKLVIGDIINATATDYTNAPGQIGTTSEFSPNFLIQPINPCPKASIVKAWVGKDKVQTNADENVGPAVTPADKIPTYAIGEKLNFTITVTNEDKVYPLNNFNIKDDVFAGKTALDKTSLVCTPSKPSGTWAAGTPAGVKVATALPGDLGGTVADLQVDGTYSPKPVITPVTTYGEAALVAGVDIHMVDPILPAATFVLDCKVTVANANGQITNTATLAQATDPVDPAKKLPLVITLPSALKQTDLTLAATLGLPPVPVAPVVVPLANPLSLTPLEAIQLEAYRTAQKAFVTDTIAYEAALLANIAKIQTDRIDAEPPIQEASIVKAWVGKTQTNADENTGPAVSPADLIPKYKVGETLNFKITITNEHPTADLSIFNLKDDSFAANASVDKSTLACAPSVPTVPVVASFTDAILSVGTNIILVTPLKPKEIFVLDCTILVVGVAGQITNTATLAEGKDAAGVVAKLRVVAPVALSQTDLTLLPPVTLPVEPIAPVAPVAPTATAPVEPVAPVKPVPVNPANLTLAEKYALIDYENALRAYEVKKALYDIEKTKFDAAQTAYDTAKATYDTAKATYDTAKATYDADKVKYDAYLAALVAKLANLSTDRIDAIPVVEEASIVKSWDAGVEPEVYDATNVLKFTITVYNESLTETLTGFTIKDSGFDADVDATMTCTPVAPGLPAGPFDLAAMTAGVSFKPTTAIPVGGKAEFKCEQTVKPTVATVAPAVITNKAILSAFNPAVPAALDILKPKTNNTTAVDQTDKTAGVLKNDPTSAEDSITAIPRVQNFLSIQKAFVTDPVLYVAGDTLDFTIKITNEGTSPITKFNLADDSFGGKVKGITCDNAYTPSEVGSDMTIAPLAPKAVLTITCTAKAPLDDGILTNKATLKPYTGDVTTFVVMPQTLSQSDSDPKADLTIPNQNTPLAQNDSIFVPPAPVASIQKAWDLPATNPLTYKAGDVLKFTITVTNESKTAGLSTFKLKDDNFTDAEVAGDMVCTPTPAPTTAATFDKAGLAAGVVYVTTTPIAPQGTVKFACTVTATTATKEIVNTATLEKATPTDKLGVVAPVALKQTDENITDAANIAKDAIRAVPAIEQASLIKAWVLPKAEVATYQAGDTLNFTITVANESATNTLSQFLLKDTGFDLDANPDLECTPNKAPLTPLTATELSAGKAFIPTVAIPVGEKVIFTCKQTIKTSTATKITNKAVLAPAFALQGLEIVKPTALPGQTDALTSPTANDITNTEDSITATPIFPSASIIKAWVGANPSPYTDGATVTYTVKVTNESTNGAVLKSFKLSDDNFAGKVTPGACTAAPAVTTPATIPTPLPATDIIMTVALAPDATVTFTCTGTIIAGTTGDLINTAILAPSADEPKLTIVDPKTPQSDEAGASPNTTDTIKATKQPIPSASVKKVWNGTAPTSYKPGDTFKYDIIVTNESPLGGANLSTFTLDDDGFGGKGIATTCTGDATFKTPFTAQAVVLATPIAPTAFVTFACTGTFAADATARLVNVVTLTPTLGTPLTIVKPSAGTQSDADDSTKDAVDAGFNKDSIVVPPAPSTPTASIQKKFTASPVLTEYKAGSDVSFTITVTNEGTVPVTEFKIDDDLFAGDTNIVISACDKGLTTPFSSATIKATIAVDGKYEIKCTAAVIAAPVLPLKTIINTVTLSKATDPLTVVTPVKGPAQTDGKQTDPADIPKDAITLPPAGSPKASIVKAWAPTKTVTNYVAGDNLDFTISIKNEGTVAITEFNLADDEFAGLAKPIVCTGDFAYTAPAADVKVAIAVGATVKITCTIKAPATLVKLTNTATLAGTTAVPLTVVVPTQTPGQSDGKTGTPADDSMDSISIDPRPIYTIKKVLVSPTEYKAGDTVNYTIKITNLTPTLAIKQVKLTDDCGGGLLENCVLDASPDAKYDAATSILNGITWTPGTNGSATVASSSITVKYSGKVKAGTTGPISNKATIDPTLPIDPLGTPVLPLCATDPTMTDFTNADGSIKACEDDAVVPPAPIPPVEQASIVKAWDFLSGYYVKGETIAWTVTVTNEGTIPLTKFNIKDDNFGGDKTIDELSCFTGRKGTEYTSAQLIAGFDFVPETPLAPGEYVEFSCMALVLEDGTEGNVITNTAFLAPAAGQTLDIVPPNALQQSDLNTSSPEDIAKDEIYLQPEIVIPETPAASIIKRWINMPAGGYSVGDKLEFEIIIGNEGNTDINSFSLKDDMFDGATNLSPMTCDKGFESFGQTDFILLAGEEILPGQNYTIKCSVTVTADSGQVLKNTATLIFYGDIYEPDTETPGRESGQSDKETGNPADDAKDSIKISPKPKTIVPVVVTPRTGGQIAIGVSIIALAAIAFLTLRKRFSVKK